MAYYTCPNRVACAAPATFENNSAEVSDDCTGPTGPVGPTGPQGVQGNNGPAMNFGTDADPNGIYLGVQGDLYKNTYTGEMWVKASAGTGMTGWI